MFRIITPEQAGIESQYVEKFIRTLNKRGLATHSVLLMRGNNIFGEFYWKPFHKDFCHRMYSVTKSFVSVAIGLLEEDGLLQLDDPIANYFPEKIDGPIPEYVRNLTIRQMLTMQTCGDTPYWFTWEDPDRVHIYLNQNQAIIPGGMRWEYDSPGSQVLSTLVEKLSEKSLFEFLDQRIFHKLGTFRTASILKTKTNDSFGDSAMLCTARDMASFARFVMNYGTWNNERLMNETYLRTATSPLVDNDCTGFASISSGGYGYQFWCLGDECFFFNGMGAQLAFCWPEKDLIFVINSDNQGFVEAKSLIYTAFVDIILENLYDNPLPENPEELHSLQDLAKNLELLHIPGPAQSPYSEVLNNKVYICQDNPTGITKFSFHFSGTDRGEFHYTNAQGDKTLHFGLGKNIFGKFPQFGYSGDHAGLSTEDGSLYDCAASAAWREPQKLLLKVQIIDRYFGNLLVIFSFKDDLAVVRMEKTAENFLQEYSGTFLAEVQK